MHAADVLHAVYYLSHFPVDICKQSTASAATSEATTVTTPDSAGGGKDKKGGMPSLEATYCRDTRDQRAFPVTAVDDVTDGVDGRAHSRRHARL